MQGINRAVQVRLGRKGHKDLKEMTAQPDRRVPKALPVPPESLGLKDRKDRLARLEVHKGRQGSRDLPDLLEVRDR